MTTKLNKDLLNTLSYTLFGTASFWRNIQKHCLNNPRFYLFRQPYTEEPRKDCRQARRHPTAATNFRAPTEDELLGAMVTAYNARLEEQGEANVVLDRDQEGQTEEGKDTVSSP
jgi:hypothetical protein